MSTEKKTDTSLANSAVANKYKTAGRTANKAIAVVRAAAVEGAKIFDLCQLGDKAIVDELNSIFGKKMVRGIAFPTCVNPNNIPAHFAPESEADPMNLTLQNGDVINIMLGAQVDGFPAVVAETLVVGESKENPITGKKADLLHSAWNASEAAVRTLVAGKKNWDVTNIVDQITADFETSAVQSMLSHNQDKNVLYGPKEIILNPAKEHKNSMETHHFAQNEVYGLDILVSTSKDGKVKKSNYKTTLYKLTGNNYSLRMKASQNALKEFKEKVKGNFPANVKIFDEPRKVRVGLIECANHEVVLPYDIMEEKKGESIAQFFTTVGITADGVIKYTSPSFDGALYNTDKAVKNEETVKLISTPVAVPEDKKPQASA